MALTHEEDTALPVMSEVTRRILLVLESSGVEYLTAQDLLSFSEALVYSFPEEQQRDAALTILVIVQSLIAHDAPTLGMNKAFLQAVQGDVLIAMLTEEIG